MPFLADLICVPPDRVGEVWPQAERHIRQAMFRGGLGDFETVKRSVLAGQSLLWLAHHGSIIIAAAVTSLEINNGIKACLIVACGGFEWCRFGHLLGDIEKYAKAEGCARVRIIGRKGWGALLPEYSVTRHVFEKALG
jgi:hypothetical protein